MANLDPPRAPQTAQTGHPFADPPNGSDTCNVIISRIIVLEVTLDGGSTKHWFNLYLKNHFCHMHYRPSIDFPYICNAKLLFFISF